MADIIFDSGLVEYNLNGRCKVVFNPTDMAFIERVFEVFDTLDEKQESYRTAIDSKDGKEVFDIARRMNEEMRELIDGVFDTDVSSALFGEMSVYAVANGLPVWANLLLAVMDEMDSAFAREKKLTNPRIQKYTQKYRRK